MNANPSNELDETSSRIIYSIAYKFNGVRYPPSTQVENWSLVYPGSTNSQVSLYFCIHFRIS